MRVEQFILRRWPHAAYLLAALINFKTFNPGAQMRNVNQRQPFDCRLRTPARQTEPQPLRPQLLIPRFVKTREPDQPCGYYAVNLGLRFGLADADGQRRLTAVIDLQTRIPATD